MKKIFPRRIMLAVFPLLFCVQSAFGMLSRFAAWVPRPATNLVRGFVPRLMLNNYARMNDDMLRMIMTSSHVNTQFDQNAEQKSSQVLLTRPSLSIPLLKRSYYQSPHMSIKMRLALLASRLRSKIMPRAMTPASSKIDYIVDEKMVAEAQKSELRYEQLICLALMQDLIKNHVVDNGHWGQLISIVEHLIKHTTSFKRDFIALFTDTILCCPQTERKTYIKLLEASSLRVQSRDLNDYFVNACLHAIKQCALKPQLFKESKLVMDNVANLVHELSKMHDDLIQKILKVVVLNASEELRDECFRNLKRYGIITMNLSEQLLVMQYLREKEHREFMEQMRVYEKEIKQLRREVEDARSEASSASTFAMLSFFNSELNS